MRPSLLCDACEGSGVVGPVCAPKEQSLGCTRCGRLGFVVLEHRAALLALAARDCGGWAYGIERMPQKDFSTLCAFIPLWFSTLVLETYDYVLRYWQMSGRGEDTTVGTLLDLARWAWPVPDRQLAVGSAWRLGGAEALVQLAREVQA